MPKPLLVPYPVSMAEVFGRKGHSAAVRSSLRGMKPILPIALAALLLLPGAADAVTRGTVVPESRYP